MIFFTNILRGLLITQCPSVIISVLFPKMSTDLLLMDVNLDQNFSVSGFQPVGFVTTFCLLPPSQVGVFV